MDKLLIFAGTYEGRVLCEFLNNNKIKATASVATQYAEQILQNLEHITLIQGRLNQKEIQDLIIEKGYQKIIDATHPYAQIVSENIKEACKNTKSEYIRLLRKESDHHHLTRVKTIEEAVTTLNSIKGNILLTTGSKELEKYKNITDFEKRVFARVLPFEEVVKTCQNLGVKGRNLICMQGPFSQELNMAMLKEYNIKTLVTKSTGQAGGFDEKISAAKALGVKVIVINRPSSEEIQQNYTLEEVINILGEGAGQNIKSPMKENNIETGQLTLNTKKLRYFPAFVDTVDKTALIIGAGEIGQKRAQKLTNFNFKVTVIDPKIKYKIEGVDYIEKTFEEQDLKQAFLVIAATNNRKLNSHIAALCKEKSILCSVADKGREGSFIFPALINTKQGLIAISSDGQNPKTTKQTAEKLRQVLNQNLEVQGENSCWK